MSDIDNSDDVIDSRDVEKRIDELDSERGDLESAVEEAQDALDNLNADAATEEQEEAESALRAANMKLREWDGSDEAEELKTLKAFREELEDYCPDWRHGTTLIRDSYFKDYAEELAEDLHGDAVRNASWPLNCIDWEKAARELQIDYTSGEFNGVTYWAR